MTTNRKMAENPCSLSRDTANAVMGVAKASPVSTAAGMASTAVHDDVAPNSTITRRKATLPCSRRKVT